MKRVPESADPAVAEPVERQVDHEEDRAEPPAGGVGDEDREARRLARHETEMGEDGDGESRHAGAVGNPLGVFEQAVAVRIGHGGDMREIGAEVQRP